MQLKIIKSFCIGIVICVHFGVIEVENSNGLVIAIRRNTRKTAKAMVSTRRGKGMRLSWGSVS